MLGIAESGGHALEDPSQASLACIAQTSGITRNLSSFCFLTERRAVNTNVYAYLADILIKEVNNCDHVHLELLALCFSVT
jgi:hypothetical protein